MKTGSQQGDSHFRAEEGGNYYYALDVTNPTGPNIYGKSIMARVVYFKN
jgi:hypothetical protein